MSYTKLNVPSQLKKFLEGKPTKVEPEALLVVVAPIALKHYATQSKTKVSR